MEFPWSLGVSEHCPDVEGQGYTCMVCEERPASGHTQVCGGGEFEGRVILLHCIECVGHDMKGIKTTLLAHLRSGLLNAENGGPGLAGCPPVQHRDHVDFLEAQIH